MKKALSFKNLWDGLPRGARSRVGRALAVLPPEMRLGRGFRKALRLARQAQWWPAGRAREYQLRQLRQICGLAYSRSRFWREHFGRAGFHPSDLRAVEDIRALPTIDKDVLQANLPNMMVRSANTPGVEYVATGGTGGAPLHFYIGGDRSSVEYAYLVANWERAGYRLGEPLAEFRGRPVEPDRTGLRHEYDPLLCRHYYSNFHMSDEHIRRYLEHLVTLGPCFLLVYPSSAAALAQAIRWNDLPVPRNILGILAGSENVYEEQRAMVEDLFGCRYFSWYGHSEKLIMAAECEASTDYHVWPTYGYCELVDAKGAPIDKPGVRGEMVGTGFINRVVPFIRYRTGDYATYVGERCSACGREHLMLRRIRGHRTQEVLIAKDGSQVSWTALNMHDDTFAGVRRFQFRQEECGRATLLIAPSRQMDQRAIARIRRHLNLKLEGRIQVEVRTSDELEMTTSGKAVYVDQRIGTAAQRSPSVPQRPQSHLSIAFEVVRRGTAIKGLPNPPNMPNTRIIEPITVYVAKGISPSSPLAYPHPIRKLLAFLCQERFVWTWRKAWSFWERLRIDKQQALVVVVGTCRDTGAYCACYGSQFSPYLDRMLFRKELIFQCADEVEANVAAEQIMSSLAGRPELAATIADFSSYSQEPAPMIPRLGSRAQAETRTKERGRSPGTIAHSVPRIGNSADHRLFVVGAGAYTTVFVLPLIKGHRRDTVVDYNPLRAGMVGRRFGFDVVETDYRRVLDRAASHSRITVVIANYHSQHAATAIEFLEANPRARVMIEKPAVIGYDQFERLRPYIADEAYFVEVGFNRRHAMMVRRAKEFLAGRNEPLTLTCIVREDNMEPSHWYFWGTEGTRIYGNLCHWLDLGVYLVGSRPVELTALAAGDFEASSIVSVRFEDGSLLNLVSGVRGDGLRGVQEHIDLRVGNLTVQIHDFRKMTVLLDGRTWTCRSRTRDKGHAAMYRRLSRAARDSLLPQYTLSDFVRTCVLTEEVLRMLRRKQRHRYLDLSAMARWEGKALPSAPQALGSSARPGSAVAGKANRDWLGCAG